MQVKNILCKEHPAYKWPNKIIPKGICLMRGKQPELTNGSSFVPHAFVSADMVYQYLPWDFKAWFSGPDTTHIGILVSDEPYTGGLKERTEELVSYLAKIYEIPAEAIIYDAETWLGIELESLEGAGADA